MKEVQQILSVVHVHLNRVESFLTEGDLGKAEFRARELAENAMLLANALYREQRRSWEVRKDG